MVSSLIIIESSTKIQSVEVQNPDGTKIELDSEKNIISKDITMEFDKEYTIIVKTIEGKTIKRIIMENSEEKIRNVEELMAFRDKTNKGLNYEGKTIKLVSDLDLSSICGGENGNWFPINSFAGIFDGVNHIISNLYINTNANNQGLFGVTTKTSIVQNIIIRDAQVISTGSGVGALIGSASGIVRNVLVDKEKNEESKINGNANTRRSSWWK